MCFMRKLLLFAIYVALISGCNNTPQNQLTSSSKDSSQILTSTDHSADVAAIMKADSAWDKASEAKSAEGWLATYADDAIMMPPGGNICKDKSSREASVKKMFSTPGMSLRFQTNKVELSQSGDLGYAIGVYQWSSKDPTGKDYHEVGKYCETWKKQSDGNWKCVVDIWNADAPGS